MRRRAKGPPFLADAVATGAIVAAAARPAADPAAARALRGPHGVGARARGADDGAEGDRLAARERSRPCAAPP